MTLTWEDDEDEFEDEDEDADFLRKMHGVRSFDYGVPDVASIMNDESMGDGEYVAKALRQAKRRRDGEIEEYDEQYYYGRRPPAMPPFERIRKALVSFKEVDGEEGTVEYIRQRWQSRVNCPMCMFDSWNALDLKEHISSHREVRRYAKWWREALFEYRAMLERRRLLLENIDNLKNTGMLKSERQRRIEGFRMQLRVIEGKIRKFETSLDTRVVAKKRNDIAAVLDELLY